MLSVVIRMAFIETTFGPDQQGTNFQKDMYLSAVSPLMEALLQNLH